METPTRWREKQARGPRERGGTAVGLGLTRCYQRPKQSIEVTGSLGLTPEILSQLTWAKSGHLVLILKKSLVR